MHSDAKVIEIGNYCLVHGEEKTTTTFSLAVTTVKRIMRKYKQLQDTHDVEISNSLRKIQENYTEEELKAIAKGGRIVPGYHKAPIINFKGKTVKFGFLTDTHIGSVFFEEAYYNAFLKAINSEGVDFVCHTGDVTEGMSNRAGHVYELTHIGYEKQKEYAVELLSKIKVPMYCIDGNHDRWFIKSNGAEIVKDICERVPNMEFLGHDEGDISLNGIVIKLWHGEDGSSYATSYRLQKVIEAFRGGEKPHVLLTGHTHKQGYFFDRNVHVVSGGALSKQSSWMRGKRLPCHSGFWIIEMVIKDGEVKRFKPEWFAFY